MVLISHVPGHRRRLWLPGFILYWHRLTTDSGGPPRKLLRGTMPIDPIQPGVPPRDRSYRSPDPENLYVQLRFRHIVRNVASNWLATAVNMAVPFFLTPYVVRHLGNIAYGIWILAVSTVSYLNLLDLGMRSAVVRFVSKAQAQDRMQDARDAISGALWFRMLMAGGVGVLSIGLAFLAPHLFKIPHDLERTAQFTVLLCALGVGVTLVSGMFGAVLAAISRFDLLSGITMGQTLARAGGVLLILSSGHGLLTLACWELAVIVLSGSVTCAVALKIFPSCRVRVRRPSPETLRLLWSYSFTTFLLMIAVQIVINTDNLVVGAFLSVGMVTFYTIGSSLVSYTSQVVGALSTTFTPMASGMEASGRMDDLRGLLLRGTQATLGLVLPISLALVFRGKTFIGLWMGPQYGVISETVLRILMISLYFAIANSTAGSIMMAIHKHKPVANSAIFEALFNLTLSIILVKTIGIYGVAWGTSISMALVHLYFWPRYVKKVLDIPIRTFLWDGWGKITVCSIPFALVCILAERYWHARNLAIFFAQILVTLPVYVLCVLAVFHSDAKMLFAKWKTSRQPLMQAPIEVAEGIQEPSLRIELPLTPNIDPVRPERL
jgi:O-antigen/teichoic acid export membrane protein